MTITKVCYDGRTFVLDPGQDVDETKSAVVSAIRDGSDFVDFATVDQGTVSLLVTAQVPLRFETVVRQPMSAQARQARDLEWSTLADFEL